MSIWFRFILAVLGTWRITHLINKEDGPWDVIVKLRQKSEDGVLGQMMDCFKCTSLWTAIPFVFFIEGNIIERIVLWLAISGAAILINELISEPLIIEQGENEDGLLRTEESQSDYDSKN